MKPACAKTIKGVVAWGSLMTIAYMILQLMREAKSVNENCKSGESGCIKEHLLIGGAILGGWLFVTIAYVMIREALIRRFPVACGHRRCIFTGRSSKPLREILLSVDSKIPTEQQLQEFKDKARLYLNDIKISLEQTMTRTTFQLIFSGSAIERFGIPFMMSDKRNNNSLFSKVFFSIDALYTDLDVMFCSAVDRASLIGHGNILVEPLVTESEGFMGFAKLTSLTPGYEGECVSSKIIRGQAKDAVSNASVSHIPGIPCCCGLAELTPKIKLDSKGPAIKINIAPLFEADITICIQCSEWPPMSDWASRPRYWPSVDEVQRIMSLGCHLVAKSAPDDKHETSWRFSFSLAEVELSKLVPDAARKCFLALKIILKDHLQPVVPKLSSYHIKTIFFNTVEKVPVGFWVDANIEECFLMLLVEFRDTLLSTNCRHHRFSFINLFDIKTKELKRLAKKVERIMKDPAPFILDDGCCCLSPCCVRVPHYNFSRLSNEQFLVDYDEVTLSAEGHMVVDPGNHRQQLSEYPSPRSNDHIHSFSCPSEIHVKEIPTGPKQLVVSLPPMQNAERESSLYTGDKDDSFGDTLPLIVALPPLHQA